MNAHRSGSITIPVRALALAAGAALTGRNHEDIVAGARVLFVELDVLVAGRFHLYGDLLDDAGELIGHVSRELDLDPGLAAIGLPLLLDHRDADYVLAGLRVVRR